MTRYGGGLDPATINPPDAVAALRSFPRRWRSTLGLVADDPQAGELVARRADPSSWSTLEHTWYVADLLEWYGQRVRRASVADRPHLPAEDLQRWPEARSYNDRELETALEKIDEQASGLAAALQRLTADDWLRQADVDGADVTILTMVRDAVVQASDHLRAAERALRAARRSA